MTDSVNIRLRYLVFRAAAAGDHLAADTFYEELHSRDSNAAERVLVDLTGAVKRGEL